MSSSESLDVTLNALGDRLIVRRVIAEDGAGGAVVKEVEEAYCMIEFSNSRGDHQHRGHTPVVKGEAGESESKEEEGGGEGASMHHAVVKSESASFRAMVLDAFRALV